MARFYSDVISFRPGKLVIELCSGNFNPQNDDDRMFDEIEIMTTMAVKKGIKPILAIIIPATQSTEIYDNYSLSGHIKAFNQRILNFASQSNYEVVDYYSAMADSNGFLPINLFRDELHANEKGVRLRQNA